VILTIPALADWFGAELPSCRFAVVLGESNAATLAVLGRLKAQMKKVLSGP
jgi:hypothetical protein